MKDKHLTPKKVFWWWWWVKSDFSVSLCPFLNIKTHRHKMDKELDNYKTIQLSSIDCDLLSCEDISKVWVAIYFKVDNKF